MTDSEPDRRADTVRASRPPRLTAVLLTAVAAIAVAGAIVLMLNRPGPDPVVTLQMRPADPTAICAPLDEFAATALQEVDVAFSGTVTAASGTTVEVAADEVFRGGPIETARLRGDSGGPALNGPVLREGDQVLIAATNGVVAACGLSATDSPELRRYYDAAFR